MSETMVTKAAEKANCDVPRVGIEMPKNEATRETLSAPESTNRASYDAHDLGIEVQLDETTRVKTGCKSVVSVVTTNCAEKEGHAKDVSSVRPKNTPISELVDDEHAGANKLQRQQTWNGPCRLSSVSGTLEEGLVGEVSHGKQGRKLSLVHLVKTRSWNRGPSDREGARLDGMNALSPTLSRPILDGGARVFGTSGVPAAEKSQDGSDTNSDYRQDNITRDETSDGMTGDDDENISFSTHKQDADGVAATAFKLLRQNSWNGPDTQNTQVQVDEPRGDGPMKSAMPGLVRTRSLNRIPCRPKPRTHVNEDAKKVNRSAKPPLIPKSDSDAHADESGQKKTSPVPSLDGAVSEDKGKKGSVSKCFEKSPLDGTRSIESHFIPSDVSRSTSGPTRNKLLSLFKKNPSISSNAKSEGKPDDIKKIVLHPHGQDGTIPSDLVSCPLGKTIWYPDHSGGIRTTKLAFLTDIVEKGKMRNAGLEREYQQLPEETAKSKELETSRETVQAEKETNRDKMKSVVSVKDSSMVEKETGQTEIDSGSTNEKLALECESDLSTIGSLYGPDSQSPRSDASSQWTFASSSTFWAESENSDGMASLGGILSFDSSAESFASYAAHQLIYDCSNAYLSGHRRMINKFRSPDALIKVDIVKDKKNSFEKLEANTRGVIKSSAMAASHVYQDVVALQHRHVALVQHMFEKWSKSRLRQIQGSETGIEKQLDKLDQKEPLTDNGMFSSLFDLVSCGTAGSCMMDTEL